MKSTIIKIIAVLCCTVLISTVTVMPKPISVSAESLSSLKDKYNKAQDALNDAKTKKADQNKIKEALDDKIAATQALIDECNSQIAKYNSQISAKQAQIDAKNAEMEADKDQFRKRIRAIYMSGTQSNIQILLGAEDFSEFLILAEMTSNLSARDTELIKRINEAIAVIEEEQAGIQTLLDEQAEIKKELDAQKKTLSSEVAEVNEIMDDLDHDIAAAQRIMNDTANDIKNYQTPTTGAGSNISFSGGFTWPVAGHYYISTTFNENDSIHRGKHDGIDIAGGGISGKPIRAAADGYVYIVRNSCTHNYGKKRSCGCGGGYGNYVAINHGPNTSNGKTYKTLYAHMSKVAVSNGQYVKKGQIIGYVGSTGWSTGYHLHYEIIENTKPKDPLSFSFDK